MTHAAAGMLISAAVGYWVLERADKHKGFLQRTGVVVGTAIIVASFLGLAYIVSCANGGLGAYCPVMRRGGYSSPMTPRSK